MKLTTLTTLPHLLTLLMLTTMTLTTTTLTSCVTSKNAEKHIMLIQGSTAATPTTTSNSNSATTSATATLKARQKQQPNATATQLTASCKLRVNLGGKELSANGRLQMKRGGIIRLSARFLGIEVMTLEFTPTGVTAIDRVNHQYATAQYDEVKLIKTSELNYHSLEALFWNEIFLPGTTTTLTEAQFAQFQAEQTPQTLTLTPTTTPLLNYHFQLNPTTLQLTALNVEPKSQNTSNNTNSSATTTAANQFQATYADFSEKLGSRCFPTQLTLTLGPNSSKPQSLQLTLSSLNTKTPVDTTPTQPSSKYKKRTLAELGL